MRYFALAAFGLAVTGCFPSGSYSPQATLDQAEKDLSVATSDLDRFYSLTDAAKASFELGKTEVAREYAEELLALLPQFEDDWNYGNAVHDGNLVLGRIAVKDGLIDDAKQFLVKAGETPGSPQLDSFGPNMSLAKDLLAEGEKQAVLEYFELCRVFWDLGHEDLDEWSKQVKAGKVPDFGANLIY